MINSELPSMLIEFLVNYLLHSTSIFLAVVAALLLLRRTGYPELRVLAWKLALVLPVVTALAATMGMLPHFGVGLALSDSDAEPRQPEKSTISDFAESDSGFVAGAEVESNLPGWGVHWSEPSESATSPGMTIGSAVSERYDDQLPGRTAGDVSWMVIGCWAAGGLLGILVLFRDVRNLQRLRSGSRVVSSGNIHAIMNRLRRTLGVGKVELRIAVDQSGPLAAGIRNPFLLLPSRMQVDAKQPEGNQPLSPEEWNALLAHELAHFAHGDPKWNLVAQVVQRTFFFQPVTGFIRRQLQKEMDFVADAHAARVLGIRAGLASCLVRFASELAIRPNGRPRLALTAGMASFRSTLGQRVETLLDESNALHPLSSRRRTAFLAVAVMFSIVLTAIVPRAVAQHSEQTPSPESSETGTDPMKKHSATVALLAATLAPISIQESQADEKPAAASELRTTPDNLPEGIRRFNGMVVGRLAAKDIERGTFVVNVDTISRVWRNSRAENPHSIVGKVIEVGGVTGKWLDVLVITRVGETVEFECQHDGDGLRFPGELLRKVAPYKPEDYPVLPETFRGFQGALVADIVKKDPESFELIVKVSDVSKVWEKNAAKEPASIKGRSMLLAGFWNRKEAYHGLKPGDRIEFGVQHISRQSDHLNVAEFVRKSDGDSAVASMKRMERERGEEKMGAGSKGFRGMLVGRIVKKDIERGTFTVKVDAVPRVWKNNQSRNPKTMIGQEVSAGGVAGKMLDALVVARVGDTVEFGALSDGEEIRVGEVLRKVAPVKPGDYPELPEAARGLQAMVTAKITKKDEHMWGLTVEVSAVNETFGGNRATQTDAIVGKPVMLAGFWNRKDLYHDLNVGDVIRCGVRHDQPLTDHLSVIESVRKVED